MLPAGIGYAAFGQKVLKYGTTDHADVRVLQAELHRLGYAVSVDGNFGQATRLAVEAFQRAHHLTPDGIVGNTTFIVFGRISRAASRGADPRGALYVVKPGDSFASIAQAEGVPVSALEAANPHINPTALQVGASLVIPSASFVAQSAPATSSFGVELSQLAMKYAGVRYVYGGTDPAVGFDCSGFVYFLASRLGVTLPRTASGQFDVGQAVARDDLEPGDLLFFNTDGYASHVGIYIGNDEFMQAEDYGTVTHLTSLSDGYWAARYIGARRIDAN